MPDLIHPDRDLFIDSLRMVAVLIVVVGHAVTTTVVWGDERIAWESALSVIVESHWATWILQVMPVLFFTGGFSNARSLTLHQGDYLAYLRTRLTRLLTPTVMFIIVWLTIGILADILRIPDPNAAEVAADVAALPFWFLGIYLVVVAAAPPLWGLHNRFGWKVPVGLVLAAAIVDIAVHGYGFSGFGVANYVFVWFLPHQLGFFYADGRLTPGSNPIARRFATMGMAGLIALVTVANYPVSLIGVVGEARWNTNPPSLALVALTFWLVGLALLIGPRLRLPTRIGRYNLTLYLWHVSAMAVAAAIIYPMGFGDPATGTVDWWVLRPLWLAAIATVLLPVVFALRRFEIHPRPTESARFDQGRTRRVAAGLGVSTVAVGLLGFGVTGFDQVTTSVGESVLGVSMNPLLNTIHVALGLLALSAAFRARNVRAWAALISAGYLVLAGLGWMNGLVLLASNGATARLHLALGLGGAIWLLRAAVTERDSAPVGA